MKVPSRGRWGFGLEQGADELHDLVHGIGCSWFDEFQNCKAQITAIGIRPMPFDLWHSIVSESADIGV